MWVNITIPVFNEESQLQVSVSTVVSFVRKMPLERFEIVVADNGSTDQTADIGRELESRFSEVSYRRINQKGRGMALLQAWSESNADILSYMDVDLSTNLSAMPHLLEAIRDGSAEIAIGSRLMPDSSTTRGPLREALSRSYNFLLKHALLASFSDAQCGFKAIRKDAWSAVMPFLQNRNWFFDTELLIIAQSLGFAISEIPVVWTDDPDSRVKIIPTVIEDLKGIFRLRKRITAGEFVRSRNVLRRTSRRES